MSQELKEYQTFVDDIVDLNSSVQSKWVLGNGYPETPENEKSNELLSALSVEQRHVLADMLQKAMDSGIHDTLAYLNEQMLSGKLQIIKGSMKLPVEPYGTELHFDWVARSAGDEWPEKGL